MMASTECWPEEQVITPPISKSRRKERLHDRLYVEFSVKTGGATIGRNDWHYTNLQTGKWFRSKEEVLQDLDNEKQQPTSNTVAAKVRAWKPESDVGASRKQQG